MLGCVVFKFLILNTFYNLYTFRITEVVPFDSNYFISIQDKKVRFILCSDKVSNCWLMCFEFKRKCTRLLNPNTIYDAGLNTLKSAKTNHLSYQ